MTTTARGNASFRRPPHRRGAMLAAAVAGLLGAGCVNAQVLVHDPGAVISNEHGFAAQLAQTVDQYAKQVEQYATQLEQLSVQYQQFTNLLVTLGNLPNALTMPGGPIPHLDASALAPMRCGASGGSIPGGLMASLASAFESSYLTAQRQICRKLVEIEIEKYNSTADMLDRIKGPGGYAELARKLEAMREALGRLANGDLGSINNQATRNMANLNAEMYNWQAGIAGYDAMLKSLEDLQSTLANNALNGRPTLLGTGIQAAALAAALHVEE